MMPNRITKPESFRSELIVDRPAPAPILIGPRGRAQAYASQGVSVMPVKGHSWHTTSMVAIPHDGVQYCIDDRDIITLTGDATKMKQLLNQRNLIVERHHTKVKEIYGYCEGLNLGPIWALCAGRTQCQVFFGCKDGYLGVLCLNEELHTLVINYKRNNKYFPAGFCVEGVRLRRYK